MNWKLTNKEVTYNYIYKYCKKNKNGWRLPSVDELKEYVNSIPDNKIKKYWVNGTKSNTEFLTSIYDFNIGSVVYTSKERTYYAFLCKQNENKPSI